jgi:hypothetical protein
VSPLKSQTTYKDVANSVSKFGGILFTPIRLTALPCYASRPVRVRILFRSQNVPHPPPKLLQKHRYISRHLITVYFSQLAKGLCHCVLWILLALRCTMGRNINTGLWSGNAFLTRKVVSGLLYPYNLDKINARKSEISINIHVYGYRRAHRPASCNVGVIFRGCGVVKCNTQPSIY